MSEFTMPRTAVVFRLAASVALALAVHNVHAAEPTELPAMEIKGERLYQSSNVTAEELAHFQAADLEDVFAAQPEVSVGGGHSVAQKLYMRGLEDTLLNISIDGAQQAGQTFHHTGRINVEPELLKEVDVRAGTTDALAGPGALGGAIKFVTKDPEDLLRPGEQVGALVKGGYFSNAEGYKANGTLFGRFSDDWSAMLMGTYQDQNDYEDGNGTTVTGTASRQQLGFAKLVGHLTDSQTVRLSYERREDDGERNQRPQWVTSDFNPAYPLTNDRETWNLGYEFNPESNPFLDLKLTAYQTSNHLEQNVIGRWGLYEAEAETWGADLRNTSLLGGHELAYGVDYRRDEITAGPGTNPTEQEQDGKVYGIYAQDYWQLAERWLLGFGGRYDTYKFNSADGQSFDESGFSPNASLAYQITPNLNLRAAHTGAFRGPQVRDGFKAETATLDPDLKPEEARTNEIGFDYAKGGWLLSGKLYRTDIKDAIADPVPRPQMFINAGDLESKGYLVQTAYHWDAVSVGLSYHHNDATIDGEDLNVYEHNGLGTSIGDTWVASADYRVTESLELGWQGRFVERLDSVDTGVGEIDKPGYGVHDVYASWLPLQSDDLTLSLTVKNLLDKQYLDHASNEDFQSIPGYEGIIGSYEPGREIRLGVAMRF
ncbi:TonB-dependent receptor domain-containing protein [Halopseudomonas sp.]|uniref:TonB-dependent receptor domain-containing protein n=1 Tax=Halopseudomonas sp. TaxID=2901191 RepID=UPI00300342F5